jgi:cytochrome c biogenesis protein CcmG, thiol:disulfide interchange protein DsbE
MLATVARLGLLAYGVTSSGRSQTIDDALAEGVTGTRACPDPVAARGRCAGLNFWASWCVPCRVLRVNVLDVSSDARAFVGEYGRTYPMLRDAGGDRGKEFGVVGHPETFVLDRRGRIVAIKRGPVDEGDLRRQVLPLQEGTS